ncbi:hypothetical protein O3P69_011986 [Scylla paramamosain]|uniref:Uncharacterized protein n=1 Tax=Scylla paramamosain TaxID=85552 RepID=A0AAW0SB28_SCYPA
MLMLEDTLTILRSDEIKLASLKSRPEDTDQPTDQAEQAVMAGMVIKKTIISQVLPSTVGGPTPPQYSDKDLYWCSQEILHWCWL